MNAMIWIAAIALIAVGIGFSAYGIKLFRKMICREPYALAPTPEEAEEPMKLDSLWSPYRMAFQEGKKFFCLADRDLLFSLGNDG